MRALILVALLWSCGAPEEGRRDSAVVDAAVVDAAVVDPCAAACPSSTFTCIHAKIFRDYERCGICHGSDDASRNFGRLTIPADKALAHAAVLGDSAAIGAPWPKLVAPGRPEESWLYLKLSDPNVRPGSRMPKLGALEPCEIDAVRAWIAGGAPND